MGEAVREINHILLNMGFQNVKTMQAVTSTLPPESNVDFEVGNH
jgi:hypothetical protein